MSYLQKTSVKFHLGSKAALSSALAFLIAVTPSFSLALNVQIQHSINLRVSTPDSSILSKVGSLAAGSIVSIPDEFAMRDSSGSVDFELTLNNWLSKASKLAEGPGLKSFSETKKDFYFPVKIVKPAPGSQVGSQDSYMIALQYLQRKGNLLETTDAAPLMQSSADSTVASDENLAPSQSSQSQVVSAPASPLLQATTNAPVCLECQRSQLNESLNPIAQSLQASLDSELNGPLQKMRKRTTKDVNAVIKEFQKTCGMSINSFIPALRNEIAYSSLRRVAPNALSSTLLLSLMSQESTGNCRVTHKEGNGTSVGLFQVNTRRNPYPLTNPIANVRAALNTLEGKYETLSRDFDFSKMSEEDRLRVIISAYNGGERWVLQAKSDLLAFNRQQGTHLDYNNWEDLRIFYFRNYLNNPTERNAFGFVSSSQRATKNTLLNLSYTENLIPRTQSSSGGESVQDAWNQRLYG